MAAASITLVPIWDRLKERGLVVPIIGVSALALTILLVPIIFGGGAGEGTSTAPAAPPMPSRGADLSGLFAPAAAPPATPAAPADGLTLYGIMGGRGNGSAIIADSDAVQRLFRVGRAVRPGVILQSLDVNSVILLRDNVRFRLALVENGQSKLAALGGETKTAAVAPAAPVVATVQASKAAVSSVLSAASGSDGGKGFKVSDAASVPIFQKAGIKPGDVILTVNGRPFDTQEKADTLIHQSTTGATLIFGIEREGKTMGLTAAM